MLLFYLCFEEIVEAHEGVSIPYAYRSAATVVSFDAFCESPVVGASDLGLGLCPAPYLPALVGRSHVCHLNGHLVGIIRHGFFGPLPTSPHELACPRHPQFCPPLCP